MSPGLFINQVAERRFRFVINGVIMGRDKVDEITAPEKWLGVPLCLNLWLVAGRSGVD